MGPIIFCFVYIAKRFWYSKEAAIRSSAVGSGSTGSRGVKEIYRCYTKYEEPTDY